MSEEMQVEPAPTPEIAPVQEQVAPKTRKARKMKKAVVHKAKETRQVITVYLKDNSSYAALSSALRDAIKGKLNSHLVDGKKSIHKIGKFVVDALTWERA